MNNSTVQGLLDECERDLSSVSAAHAFVGATNPVALYLTRYALIRACGSIEVAYKAIVADYCSRRSKPQLKRYLGLKVRQNSSNPTFGNICKLVKEFDEGWNKRFKASIQGRGDHEALLSACQSLVDARNEFAHGGSPSVSLGDVVVYFGRARAVIEELDLVVA